jgi:hypothetical protein
MSATRSAASRPATSLLRRHLDDAARLIALGEHRSAEHLVGHVLDVADTTPADRDIIAAAIDLLCRMGLRSSPKLCGS